MRSVCCIIDVEKGDCRTLKRSLFAAAEEQRPSVSLKNCSARAKGQRDPVSSAAMAMVFPFRPEYHLAMQSSICRARALQVLLRSRFSLVCRIKAVVEVQRFSHWNASLGFVFSKYT